jgi:GH24 family phage-related lysozyme (muramidase)
MPAVRPVPQFLPAFTGGNEGSRKVAYLDQGHVWTCGDGHTGPDVTEGTTCDDGTRLRWLYEDLTTASLRISRIVKAPVIDALSENRWGSLVDFAFNTGANPDWTIWADLNAGNLSDVPFQLGRFNKYRDPHTHQLVTSEGLNHRRSAEVAMWNTPDPMDSRQLVTPPPLATAIMANAPTAQDLVAPSSAFLRNVETPPVSAPAQGFFQRLLGAL